MEQVSKRTQGNPGRGQGATGLESRSASQQGWVCLQRGSVGPAWHTGHRAQRAPGLCMACWPWCPRQPPRRKESYMTQNSLDLKLSSGSSPPLCAKQRSLSPEEKKIGH